MNHLHTSKTFADDLNKAGYDFPFSDKSENPWHWYAHRITLLRKKCVIVMEEQSRYALIFFGLKKPDFSQFDKVLTSRIIAEASWLCDLPHPGPNEKLIAAVEQRCSIINVAQGLDRSVQAHIRQVGEEMEIMVKYHDGRLPETAAEEFALGQKINGMLRKRGGDKDYFYPREKWRKSLLALVSGDRLKVVNIADHRTGRGNHR